MRERKRKRRAWLLGAACLSSVILVPAAAQAATADLAIVKSDSPDPVAEGAVLTFAITVTNQGPGAAAAATVTDKLDNHVDFLSAAASQGTCDRKGRTVTCALGTLGAPGSSDPSTATVTISVRPTKAGQLDNVASVEVGPGDTDPNAANNSDSEPTTVVAADGGGGPTCAGQPATIVGTGGAETLVGQPGPDVLVARGGNDLIRGLGGNDVACGGGGNDRLKGGGGDDLLKGGHGRDLLRGGPGADDLFGGGGRDRCGGGPGPDTEHSC